MAANFPSSLPSIARVLPTDYMNDPGKEADLLHNEIADEIEALAAVKGREPTREAFAVVVGSGGAAKAVMRSFDVPERDKVAVDELAASILSGLSSKGLRQELLLAALAKAGLALAGEGD